MDSGAHVAEWLHNRGLIPLLVRLDPRWERYSWVIDDVKDSSVSHILEVLMLDRCVRGGRACLALDRDMSRPIPVFRHTEDCIEAFTTIPAVQISFG